MPNLTGIKVKHKSPAIGDGIIISQEGTYFVVQFPDKNRRFAYPAAFSDGFLSTDDKDVLSDLKEVKAEKEQLDAENKEKARLSEQQKKDLLLKKAGGTVQESKDRTKPEGQNLAFKCNYCDGGKSKYVIGFSGVCSAKTIEYNIRKKHRDWCSQQECPCRQFYDGKISRKELEDIMSGIDDAERNRVCYESFMLIKWQAFAGTNNNPGPKQGTRRRIADLAPYKLCFLTTRFPGSRGEDERVVFAAFIIGSSDEGDDWNSGFVQALDDYTISLNEDEARKVKYWDHYSNRAGSGEAKWGTGLYRKLTDEQALSIMDNIIAVKKGTWDEKKALMMKEFFQSKL